MRGTPVSDPLSQPAPCSGGSPRLLSPKLHHRYNDNSEKVCYYVGNKEREANCNVNPGGERRFMDTVKILEVKENVFDANEVNARTVREQLTKEGRLVINVMSSPGSGKTTTLKMINRLIQPLDPRGFDVYASRETGEEERMRPFLWRYWTGGMCHMDAQMTKQGLDAMGMDDVDVCFIENVGNLVCPAEYDTGAQVNITILSVPEGDDKPAKYPLIYQVSELVLINKIDAMGIFDFDKELVEERIHKQNPEAKIIYISAKTGEGFYEWIAWLKNKLQERNA